MLSDSLLTWFILGILTKKRRDALCRRFGDLDRALEYIDSELLRELGCRKETVLRTMELLSTVDLSVYRNRLEKLDVRVTFFDEASFPERLKEIPDSPIFLSYRGDLEILRRPCLGLVGTRVMSNYGKRVTERFIPDIVRSGIVTVSGLALGIDSTVAEETLLAHGKTVAVLGHGLRQIYPQSNVKLADRIVSNGGLLLSEYPLDFTPDKFTFPGRNRIIAALSRGVVVLEAGEGSGALITADLALDYGRDVFAVPGSVFEERAAGCHAIIARGEAKLVTSSEEILRDIGVLPVVARDAAPFLPANQNERTLWEHLSGVPQSVTALVEESALPPALLSATLTALELRGAARNIGGMWVRT